MKRIDIFLGLLLLVMSGCGGGKQSTDFITVDVTKNYPSKELILQDFLDVEYIALETTDEFLTQGEVMDVGKEIILVKNQVNDGDIFVFDRKGIGLRKINRRGQGPEEYTFIGGITLDEDNGEMFIYNYKRGILVYDLYGKFLRRLPVSEDFNYMSFQNYDREHLICGDSPASVDEKSTESQPSAIISKKDGSIVNDFRIRFKQGVNTRVNGGDGDFVFIILLSGMVKSVLPYHDNWLLTELSSDTIYRLLPDFNMTPFMARTPSVHSMNPEIFLFPAIFTDRYYFMETLKKELERGTGSFPRKKIVYDKQEKTIYQYTVCNDDYVTPKTIELPSWFRSMNKEIAYSQKIEAFELVESNRKGELKGRLKDLAAKLEEEDNPVIMLVKYRNN
jgi:hypothetical protein